MPKDAAERGRLSILTGERGELAIADLFVSWHWLVQRIDMDQGTDLAVESAINGAGTGFHYFIQCKASETARATKSGIPIVVKANTLAYLKRQTSPVVIMFAVLDAPDVYWITLSDALRSGTIRKDGALRVKVPLRAPFLQRASEDRKQEDQKRFLVATGCEDPALPLQRARSAIQLEEARLAALDSRLEIRVLAGSTSTNYSLRPKPGESVTGSLRVLSLDDGLKLKEAIEFGFPHTLRLSNFHLHSDAFEALGTLRSGAMHVQGDKGGEVGIQLSTWSQGSRGETLRFRGQIYRGNSGACVIGESAGHPLQTTLRAPLSGITTDGDISVHFSFLYQAHRWENRELRVMDRMEYAARCLEAIANAERVQVEIELDLEGQLVFFTKDMERSFSQKEEMHHSAEILRDLDALRELSVRYSPTMRVGRFNEDSMLEAFGWRQARDLLTGAEIDGEPNEICAQFSHVDEHVRQLVAQSSESGVFAVTAAALDVKAFGALLCRIPTDFVLRNYVGNLEENLDGSVALHLIPTINASVRLRRSTAGSPTFSDPFWHS